MPASRKPRRKGPVSPSSKSAPGAVKLPDRRAMESFMSAIGTRRAESATDKAQDVMYEAWDQAEPRKRIALANKALTISPLCADAYVLLAEEKAKSDWRDGGPAFRGGGRRPSLLWAINNRHRRKSGRLSPGSSLNISR